MALLKTLSSGVDVQALFQARELDAPRWAACVQAWNGLLVKRPELATRFAALLQAEWG